MGSALVWLINSVIGLILLLIVVRAVVSWLVAFDVINTRNRVVFQILEIIDRLTDPILRPIQRVIPTLGGVDLSPIIAWLALGFLQRLFNASLAPMLQAALG